MEKYKFSNSKIYKLNEKLNKKPYKYVYKELLPKKIYDKLQSNVYLLNQKTIAKDWDNILKDYFENKVMAKKVKPKKTLTDKNIIWQFWGQGWDYEKLPSVVKICYKSMEKYGKGYTVIRLDNESMKEYLDIPEYILEKLNDKRMGYAHFSDILRFALLSNYGGVWMDATILLTDYLSEKYFEMDYFLFQRDENLENKKEWEDYDSIYFSWSKKSKVRMLSSVIFSHKNNKVINTLLDMLMIFWENNDSVPNYFILQILYNELIENYYKKEQCQVISDTFPHEMFRVWFDKYSEDKLQEITKKSSIHKLSFKIENSKRKKDGTFFEYFEKMYEIE